MRIAQVSPLAESVPPQTYGGTERVVHHLTEELVRRGHDVTLFASGDSVTSARLVAPCPVALWKGSYEIDVYHALLLEQLFRMSDEFDVIHFHYDFLHFSLATRHSVPFVTTMHGRLDIPDLLPLFRAFPDVPVVSISDDQRRPLPWLNWRATIYHGLPLDLLSHHPEGGDYLAFIGRTSPEKGLDKAIEIARRVGMPLKVSATVQPSTREYFEEVIEPMLDDPLIEMVGEKGDGEKNEFLGNAFAVLFPIDWPEPFGLVVIEAMATGTPVIAFRRGAVPELLVDGETGFVVDSVDEAVERVKDVERIDRNAVRRRFEERFNVVRMVDDYERVYRGLLEETESPISEGLRVAVG